MLNRWLAARASIPIRRAREALAHYADQISNEATTMTAIHRDYLDNYDRQRKPAPFPRDLAARKAEAMARRLPPCSW